MKTDQTEFMERTLTVAISAPPAASDKPNQGKSSFSSAPRKPITARPEQKSRISFVPASVQKAVTKESNVPMSNDDFRKMLLK
jgi:hypothetical protein